MYRLDESDTLDGINNNTYDLFFMSKRYNERFAKNDREFLCSIIRKFTMLDDDTMDMVIDETHIFERIGDGFIAKYNSLEYEFFLLDSLLDEKKEILRSEERYGKCIYTSISLASVYDSKCKVAIGYLDNNEDKILHAVFIDSAFDYVFDYTMNLAMPKDQYIELMDYKIINEIDGDNIKKDLKILWDIEHISVFFYLCFRDEFIKDLSRSSKVLKLED